VIVSLKIYLLRPVKLLMPSRSNGNSKSDTNVSSVCNEDRNIPSHDERYTGDEKSVAQACCHNVDTEIRPMR